MESDGRGIGKKWGVPKARRTLGEEAETAEEGSEAVAGTAAEGCAHRTRRRGKRTGRDCTQSGVRPPGGLR